MLAQDRAAEAEALSHESEALAGDDLQAAIAWRGVRAEAIARRGESEAAVELARAAVTIAAATDALLDHADARLALAAALRAAGRSGEADAEERRALDLWETKGATVLAERARHVPGAVVATGHAARPAVAAAARVRRRVRPNVASAGIARLEAAFLARDLDAIGALCGEFMETVDHPVGATYGRDGTIDSSKRMMRLPDLDFHIELLATLGESLCLGRRRVTASASSGGNFDVAEYEMEHIVISEVDEAGRCGHFEVFAPDHLSDAIVCLYARYSELLADSSERDRAGMTARAIRSIIREPFGAGRVDASFAPDIEFVDNRILGTWNASGAEAVRRQRDALHEVADDVVIRDDEVLALLPEALLLQRTHTGTERLGGGIYERLFLGLFRFGDDGKLTHLESFDVGHEAEALVRFDELVGGEARRSEVRFANAASRWVERCDRCWQARDWDGLKGAFSPGFRMDDRRRLIRLEVGVEDFLAQFRMLFDQPGSRWEHSLWATRGERLALGRAIYRAEVEGGGPLEFAESLTIYELGTDGQGMAVVLFDLEDEDAAYAEFERRYQAGEGAAFGAQGVLYRAFLDAIAGSDWDSVIALCAPTFVEYDHRHLAVLGTTRGAEAWARNFSVLAELAPDTVGRFDHLQYRGHGCLFQLTWSGTRGGGYYEIVHVGVIELDGEGRFARADIYDVDQLDEVHARFAEVATALPQRFANAATRAVERGTAALAARDWESFAELFADGFRNFDRRTMVRLESDREQWLAGLREIVELTSSRPTLELLATRGDRLALVRMLWQGAEGDIGPSELDWMLILEVDDRGDHLVVVTFDLDDLDAAYAEIDARWESGEAAVHAHMRAALQAFTLAFERRDWDSLRALCAPAMTFEDRRRLALLSGDCELMIASARERVAVGALPQLWLMGTAGDRVAIYRMLWAGGPVDGRFEIEYLTVTEIDQAGLISAIILVDADDARGAQHEAWGRWSAVDPVASRWIDVVAGSADTLNDGDLTPLRALFAEDVVADDHRWTGFGRIEGRDAYFDAVAVLWELAPDTRIELGWYWPAYDRDVAICTARRWGTIAGGGAFESDYLILYVMAEGLVTGVELFEVDALDAALARFEQLRLDSPRIPQNAATRAYDIAAEAGDAHDWEAARTLLSDDFVHDDRGKRALLSGGVDELIAGVEYLVSEIGAESRYEVLGTAGERIAIHRRAWRSAPDAAAFELDKISVTELDATGKVSALILFDGDDRAAAFQEAFDRFAGGEAATSGGHPEYLEFLRAFRERQWETARALLATDFAFVDHRTLGMGTLDRDRWIESLRALAELAPDLAQETFRVLAWNRGGLAILTRGVGTVPGGGGLFENEFAAVVLVVGGKLRYYEVFEIADVDHAIARFEELCVAREAVC